MSASNVDRFSGGTSPSGSNSSNAGYGHVSNADQKTFDRMMNNQPSISPVGNLEPLSRGLSISGGPPEQGDVWDGIETVANAMTKIYSGVIKPLFRKAIVMPELLYGPIGPVIFNQQQLKELFEPNNAEAAGIPADPFDPMGTGGSGWDDFEGYDHTSEDGGGGSGYDSDHDPRNGGKQSTSTDSDPNNDHRDDGLH